MEDIITPEVVDHWWAAISVTLAAISGGAWLGKQWIVARKAAQIALYVVQVVGRNYVDKWVEASETKKLSMVQKDIALTTAIEGMETKVEALNPILKPMVKKYIAAKSPEVLVKDAVKVHKKLKEKRKYKIGPKGGI